MSTATVGAVVLGGDYQGLGIVRSLGRRGIPVCVIDDEPSVARHSRYASHTERVPGLFAEDEVLAHTLDVGKRLGLEGWVLYPTRDEIVAALSQRRDELERFFRVPTPRWDSVSWAWDKRRTYELAGELGVSAPRTWSFRNPAELETVAQHLPLVIKPAIKEHFIYVTNVKAWRADTPEQLETLFRRAAAIVPAEEVMVQELIPGDGSRQFSYCGFFKEGRSIATMAVRRWRQRPLDFGRSSTFAETVDLPELEEVACLFLSRIDYYGLVEIEFKLDERDGEYKLLDVNPRTWGYHSLGPRAGTDFPFLLFRDQLGYTVEPVRATPGVKWVRLSTDFPTALPELLAGRWRWREYVRSLVSADVEGLFARDDPLPAKRAADGQPVRARHVIVAAGIAPFAWRPPEFADLGPDLVSHSSEHRVFDRFSERRVVVIGGGQSALESAALLHEAGARVEVLMRSQKVHFLRGERLYENAGALRDLLYPPLGVGPPGLNFVMGMPRLYRMLPRALSAPLAYRTIRPAAAAWLRPRLADVKITRGHSVASAAPMNDSIGLGLGDGSERIADHVLLGTGYRVDLRRYSFLDSVLASAVQTTGGYPVLSRFFESSVDRLYFIGAVAAASAGPGMRFVSHTGPVAAAVCQGVVTGRPSA